MSGVDPRTVIPAISGLLLLGVFAFAFAYVGRSDLVRPFTVFLIALPHLPVVLLTATEPSGCRWSTRGGTTTR
ncbi:MAG: hypothetical protein V5A38_05445 [Halolamina sp.]|uniref:hypothetical protein n=1 Tax=Halolamina sp. TaxID=1940283 RepID=UPI002FC359F7